MQQWLIELLSERVSYQTGKSLYTISSSVQTAEVKLDLSTETLHECALQITKVIFFKHYLNFKVEALVCHVNSL